MESVTSLAELARRTSDSTLHLGYFTRPDCGVCSALRPKVERLLAERPEVVATMVDVAALPEAAGSHSVFALPTVIVTVDGREAFRAARFVHVAELESALDRLRELRLQA